MKWPDWQDVGKEVLLLMPNGDQVKGKLEADEFFTGEDDCPLFTVKTEEGTVINFVDCLDWIFCTEAELQFIESYEKLVLNGSSKLKKPKGLLS